MVYLETHILHTVKSLVLTNPVRPINLECFVLIKFHLMNHSVCTLYDVLLRVCIVLFIAEETRDVFDIVFVLFTVNDNIKNNMGISYLILGINIHLPIIFQTY